MSVDGVVQVAPDSTGKKIDNTELTRADDTVVERQRTVLADEENPGRGGAARVRDGELQVSGRELATLERIAETLEEINIKLGLMLG